MRSDEKRRNEIKSMSTSELRRRLNEGRFGRHRQFVEAELVEREAESEETRVARTEKREESTRRIAIWANGIAIASVLIALAALCVAYFHGAR